MKKLMLFAITVLSAVVAFAQHAVGGKQASSTQPTSVLLENTLLWEISGNRLPRPSYLFGTMHLLCAADAQLSDSLRFAISNVKQVYFELDLDNMLETLGAMRYLTMTGNLSLSDLLTPEEYGRIKEYFRKNKVGLPISMMEHLKPYFITSLIEESKFPCAEKGGMEQVIMKQAKMEGKPIHGLETVQFQASVFDSIPYKRQAQDLLKMVDSSGVASDSSDVELIGVYKLQDLNRMQQMTAQEESMAAYIDLLLYNRNANWANKMPGIMHDAPALFAVGAGHLGGDKGVINLLRKAGFTVRPMKHRPGPEMQMN